MNQIEKGPQDQMSVITRISLCSDILSQYLPEGATWHVVSPKFKRPNISLDGYDISDQLFELACRTESLFVRSYMWPEEYDEGDYHPASYVWEIYPPIGFNFIDGSTSQCDQDSNVPGLGLTIYSPQVKKEMAPADLEVFSKSGVIAVKKLFWFEGGEAHYDWTKPESVLLNMIEHQPKVSLEVALWILESLQTAAEIHAEEESLNIERH